MKQEIKVKETEACSFTIEDISMHDGKKHKLTIVVAAAVSIISGLMILAGILLINGID